MMGPPSRKDGPIIKLNAKVSSPAGQCRRKRNAVVNQFQRRAVRYIFPMYRRFHSWYSAQCDKYILMFFFVSKCVGKIAQKYS